MNQDARPAPVPLGRVGKWAYLPFRVVVTAAAVLLFDQAVFAGQFLAGTFGSLQMHRGNAIVAALTVLGAALAAVPVRWPGRGPIWPIFACLGLFALIALQIALGFNRLLAVHVPLGVSIILLAALLTVRAWRLHPPSSGPPAAGQRSRKTPATTRESGS